MSTTWRCTSMDDDDLRGTVWGLVTCLMLLFLLELGLASIALIVIALRLR